MVNTVRRSGRVTLSHFRMLRVSGLRRCGGRRMVVVRVRAVMTASPGLVVVVPHGVSLVDGWCHPALLPNEQYGASGAEVPERQPTIACPGTPDAIEGICRLRRARERRSFKS
jgi:hypothetical protein